jgi:GT2 family glycosyltransferase
MKYAFDDGADMVITMANDIIEPAKWVEKRVEAMLAIKDLGVVAIPPNGTLQRYPRNLTDGIRWEHGEVIGNYGITRAAWEKVGGLAEWYGIYGPIDLDYCQRCWVAGLKTIYLSDEAAQHLPGADDPAYTGDKQEALRRAWPNFRQRIHRYRRGELIYHDVHTEDIEALLADRITRKEVHQ